MKRIQSKRMTMGRLADGFTRGLNIFRQAAQFWTATSDVSPNISSRFYCELRGAGLAASRDARV